MRPHIRSSTDFRRRSIAGTQDTAGGDPLRRRSTPANVNSSHESPFRRMSFTPSSQPNVRQGLISGLSRRFGRSLSISSSSGVVRDCLPASKVTPQKRDSFSGFTSDHRIKRLSESEDRRASSLDCSRQSVNSFRIKILVISFVVVFIVIMAVRYLKSKTYNVFLPQ